MRHKYPFFGILWTVYCLQFALCSDITSSVFGSYTKIKPAAFGDFNSDEQTDLFVISDDQKRVEILLASNKEPYFMKDAELNCTVSSDYIITSVVPGDFDGDALMDVLVTTSNLKKNTNSTFVFIHYGYLNSSSGQCYLNCSNNPAIEMLDEPLAIDRNLTINLFGTKTDGTGVFWKFKKNRTEHPEEIPLNMTGAPSNFKMRIPHSHAFLDLNNDNSPDLFLTGENGYGIWLYNNIKRQFVFNNAITYPKNLPPNMIGQSLFIDLETADQIYPIVPVCETENGAKSAIYAFARDRWINLNVNFNDKKNRTWGFVHPNGHSYTDTITLRAGDFNNDGFVDLLATLTTVQDSQKVTTFLLENVACTSQDCGVNRTFEIKWDAFSGVKGNTVMGTFYDFMQDGILDIIFVHSTGDRDYHVSAFKNSLDYDANFMKVMVITGLKNKENEVLPMMFLGQKRTVGTNLPGPKIRYKTTTQDGDPQAGVAAQLPQSAHFALYLPYTIFGLGRTPNFVEDLTVGMFNESKTWTQIIPNSQLVVIPYPPQDTSRWRAQLFVTPSKIILQTVFALAGTCVVIAFIIVLLHWKERREDKIERLQEAHRFHFDAM